MEFDLVQFGVCLAALLAASVVQSTIGFGMGLMTTPLLLLAGMPLPQAVGVVLAGASLQSGYSAWRLRGDIPWRSVAAALPLRTAAVLVGLAAMARMTDLEPAQVRRSVGVVLLAAVAAQAWVIHHRRRDARGGGAAADGGKGLWARLLAGGAFLASGLMAGFCGMGGPPLVLWVNSRDWPAARMRAFLLTSFALAGPFQMALLWHRFGAMAAEGMAMGLASAVVLVPGSMIGLRLGRRLNAARLRILALIMLAILALYSIMPVRP